MRAVSLPLYCCSAEFEANCLHVADLCVGCDILRWRTAAALVLSWWRAELLRKVLLGLILAIDKTFKIVLYELVLHLAGLLRKWKHLCPHHVLSVCPSETA